MKIIDLKGRTALITGATGELGRAMVRELANCGANVTICFFTQEKAAKDLQAEVEKEYGIKATAVYADVTDYDSILKMKKQVGEVLGNVDIIVNNSVVQYTWKSVLNQDISDLKANLIPALCKVFI